MLNCSAGSADLWQESFALGSFSQTLGQQHLMECSGQLPPFAFAFQLALSRGAESVALKLKATSTYAATAILKVRCMTRMLEPEAKRSKPIFGPTGWPGVSSLASTVERALLRAFVAPVPPAYFQPGPAIGYLGNGALSGWSALA